MNIFPRKKQRPNGASVSFMKKGGVICLRLRYFENGKERKKFNQFETLSEEDRQKAVEKLNAMAVQYNQAKERQGSGFDALTEDERKAITRFREYRMECFRAGITYNTLDELMGFAINRNNSLNDSPLFENALDDYLHFQDKQGHSEKHLKEITYRLRKMEKHFLGNKVGNITTEAVSKYLMNMTTQTGKLASIDSVLDYRSTLRAFFEWLLKRDIISKNPVTAAHRPRRKPKAPEIFTVEQTQSILQTALEYHPKAIPALVLGFFCWSPYRRDRPSNQRPYRPRKKGSSHSNQEQNQYGTIHPSSRQCDQVARRRQLCSKKRCIHS